MGVSTLFIIGLAADAILGGILVFKKKVNAKVVGQSFAITKEELMQIIDTMDKDGNGMIDAYEALSYVVSWIDEHKHDLLISRAVSKALAERAPDNGKA